MHASRRAHTDTRSYRPEDTADRSAIVLVHGAFADASGWAAVIRPVAAWRTTPSDGRGDRAGGRARAGCRRPSTEGPFRAPQPSAARMPAARAWDARHGDSDEAVDGGVPSRWPSASERSFATLDAQLELARPRGVAAPRCLGAAAEAAPFGNVGAGVRVRRRCDVRVATRTPRDRADRGTRGRSAGAPRSSVRGFG